MKRWLFVTLASFFVLSSFALIAMRFASRGFSGFDFRLRYNEVECLKTGVNPFLVWSEQVESDEYTSLKQTVSAPGVKFVNGYPPWAYTWLIPATNFSVGTVWTAYLFASFVQVALLWIVAFVIGLRLRGNPWDGIFCGGASLFLGTMTGYALSMGNYSISLALSAYGLAWAVSRNNALLGGLFLAILMTKPQIGVLFAIPLFVNWRWKAVFFAAAFCVALSIPPAVLCNENPITMILQVANLGSSAFQGTWLIPKQIASTIASKFGAQAPMVMSASSGLALCLFLALKLRSIQANWIRIALPPCLCCFIWTYTSSPDTILLSLVQVYLATQIIKARTIGSLILHTTAIFLNASSIIMLFYETTSVVPRDAISATWVVFRLAGIAFACFSLLTLDRREQFYVE